MPILFGVCIKNCEWGLVKMPSTVDGVVKRIWRGHDVLIKYPLDDRIDGVGGYTNSKNYREYN